MVVTLEDTVLGVISVGVISEDTDTRRSRMAVGTRKALMAADRRRALTEADTRSKVTVGIKLVDCNFSAKNVDITLS